MFWYSRYTVRVLRTLASWVCAGLAVSCLCTQEPVRSDGPSSSEVSTDKLSSSAQCGDAPVEVVDMQSGFREIWLGLEEKADGKRTERRPHVTLQFSARVPASSIDASFIPVQSGCGLQIRTETSLTPETSQHTMNGLLSKLDVVAERPLFSNCEYAFHMRSAETDGACRVKPLEVRFITASAENDRAKRELRSRKLNELTGSVGFLEPKPGIHVTPQQAIDRYVPGAASQDFSQEGEATLAALGGPHQRVFLRQHHQGLPIRNAGYFFEMDGERVVHMMGRAAIQYTGGSPTPTLSEEEAISEVLTHLGFHARPWDVPSNGYTAPTVSKTFEILETGELRLLYEVDLRESGLPGARSARVDAGDGKLLSIAPDRIQ